MKKKVLEPHVKSKFDSAIKKATKAFFANKVKVSGYKFLIVDEQYRVYKTKVLSGKLRSLCRLGDISIIRLRDMKGMNSKGYAEEHGEEWSDVQDFPTDFKIEEDN